jgi:hypothetical protein
MKSEKQIVERAMLGAEEVVLQKQKQKQKQGQAQKSGCYEDNSPYKRGILRSEEG